MKKSFQPRSSRRLSLEGLESRAMMATVSAAGGLLFISGDVAGENIAVTQTTTGQIQVTGVGATPQLFSGVVGVYADLGGGNDTISLGTPNRPLPLLTSVTLRLGDGNDTANISVNIPGVVMVDGGLPSNGSEAQNDIVNVDRSLIGSLMVNTYAGDDTLTVTRSGILSLSANVGAEGAGRDYDTVVFLASAVGMANISLGGSGASASLINVVSARSTIFGSLSILGGSGIDAVSIDSEGEGLGFWLPSHLVNTAETLEPLLESVLASPQISSILSNLDGMLEQLPSLTGIQLPGELPLDDILALLGNLDLTEFDLSDTLAGLLRNIDLSFIGDDTIIGSLTINTLDNIDGVYLADTLVLSNATISTGEGNDGVDLIDVNVLGNLFVMLAGGSDILRMADVASAIAFLDGGAGIDGLLNNTDSSLGRRSRTIINFEIPLFVTPS